MMPKLLKFSKPHDLFRLPSSSFTERGLLIDHVPKLSFPRIFPFSEKAHAIRKNCPTRMRMIWYGGAIWYEGVHWGMLQGDTLLIWLSNQESNKCMLLVMITVDSSRRVLDIAWLFITCDLIASCCVQLLIWSAGSAYPIQKNGQTGLKTRHMII